MISTRLVSARLLPAVVDRALWSQGLTGTLGLLQVSPVAGGGLR